MIKKNSTIYFYQLQIHRLLNTTKNNGDIQTVRLDIDVFKDEFIELVNKNINNYRTLSFGENDEYSFELINWGTQINNIKNTKLTDINANTKFYFGKIGKKRDILNFQRRNIETLEPHEIEKKIDEYFESFTYFYLFYEESQPNNVATIAFLKSQSAPDIRNLKLLSNFMSDPDYIMKIDPIISPDGLSLLIKKDIINTITYSVSLPIDDILAQDIFGIDEDTFDSIQDLSRVEFEISLKGKRLKNIIKNRNILKRISDKINTYTNEKKGYNSKISANAKNENEKMTEYSFLDNTFISKATFEIESDSLWEKTVEERMHEKYLSMRRELLQYVR